MLFIEIQWIKAGQLAVENILSKLLPQMLDLITDKRFYYYIEI